MIGNTRAITDPVEIEAWARYERVLDSIPNSRMYDRVSVMKAFPELQEAFDNACRISRKVVEYYAIIDTLKDTEADDEQWQC